MSARRQLGPASVSVVIPARNAEATIVRAVQSVLAQTCSPDEIVVVDDASTDGTIRAARRCGPVRIVALGRHGGAGAARNAGVRAAEGAWVAFLDADDEWLPEKLEKQRQRIEPHSDQSVIFCGSEEFSEDGTSLGDTMRGAPVDCSSLAWKSLLRRNFIATPTAMVPRDLFLQLGGFDQRLIVAEDQDMWIRLALAGRLTYVPETLACVHVRRGSLSAYRAGDQARNVIPMIERHLMHMAGRLTPEEAWDILGERLSNAARIALANGDTASGMSFMLRALRSGYRPDGCTGTMIRLPLMALARLALGGRQTTP